MKSLAGQCICCCIEAPVDFEDLGVPESCKVEEYLCQMFDSPVRGVGMVSLVEEVNQLFTVEQVADIAYIQTVNDSGSQG